MVLAQKLGEWNVWSVPKKLNRTPQASLWMWITSRLSFGWMFFQRNEICFSHLSICPHSFPIWERPYLQPVHQQDDSTHPLDPKDFQARSLRDHTTKKHENEDKKLSHCNQIGTYGKMGWYSPRGHVISVAVHESSNFLWGVGKDGRMWKIPLRLSNAEVGGVAAWNSLLRNQCKPLCKPFCQMSKFGGCWKSL